MEKIEHWCIKITKENSLIVGEYFNEKLEIQSCYTDWFNHENYNYGKYLTSHNLSKKPISKNVNESFASIKIKGQELTTEEFIKYIVNEDYNDKLYNINRLITILKFINGKTI